MRLPQSLGETAMVSLTRNSGGSPVRLGAAGTVAIVPFQIAAYFCSQKSEKTEMC